MANPNQTSEAPAKKLSVTESVEGLIQRKKHERDVQVGREVDQKMAGTQEGVAEVMAGVEKPKERVSERKGETGEKGDIRGGQIGDDDQAQQIRTQLKDYHFPPTEVMVRAVRGAIQADIHRNWKLAKKYQKKLHSGGTSDYNEAVAKVRTLKELMYSLYTATVDFMKKLYMRYFTPDGKRR